MRASVDYQVPAQLSGENTLQSRYLDSAPSKFAEMNPEANPALSSNKAMDKSLMSNSTLMDKSRSRNAGIEFDFLERELLRENSQQESKPIDIPKI